MTVRRAVSVAGAYCRPAASGQESGLAGQVTRCCASRMTTAPQTSENEAAAWPRGSMYMSWSPRRARARPSRKSSAQANAGAMA